MMDREMEEKLMFAFETELIVQVSMEDGSSVQGQMIGRSEDGQPVIQVNVVCDPAHIKAVHFISPSDEDGWVTTDD